MFGTIKITMLGIFATVAAKEFENPYSKCYISFINNPNY